MPRLTQFQNTMPWVMIAPLGWPVVPDVYITMAMSSWRQRPPARRLRARRPAPLVGAVGPVVIDLEQVLRQLARLLGERLVVDQQLGRRIAQDVFELRHGEPPVERQHDGAQPPAGELELEVLGAVGREQGDAVAAADAQRGQRRREPIRPRIELGIGELPRRLQVMDGERRRPAAGVVGDPVVGGRHSKHINGLSARRGRVEKRADARAAFGRAAREFVLEKGA